jgi:uncharacterized phage protein (TIGR01671 family)
MRTIKFRGKRCDNGEWVYGYYVESHHSWHGYHPHKAWILDDAITNGGFFALKGKRAVVNESVGQFTGLHDKNGKEIYEGDIIVHASGSSIMYIVEWHNTELVGKQIGSSSYAGISYWIDVTEVIGNIHDNPELMKGGNQ